MNALITPVVRRLRDASNEDVSIVERAFVAAENAHRGQLRKSGDPYITHPVAVAEILVAVLIMLWVFISVASKARKNIGKAPTGLQNLVEPVVIFVRDQIARPTIGDKKHEKYMPYLLTLFFFILLLNLM